MTYPSTDVITTNLDAATDSPASARTDLLDLATKFNLLRNHISAYWQNVLDDPSAAASLASLGAAASGANADLTSLSALTAINAGPLAGNRNRVINGSGRVRQRAAATVTASLQYGQADRMMAAITSGTSISGSISAGALSGSSTGQGWGLSSASWTTGVATFVHRIESANTLDLNSRVVTFSGRIYHDLGATQSVGLTIAKANTLDTFSATTTLATGSVSVASATLTSFSLSVTLGASDATNGLQLSIQYPSLSATSKTLYNADWQLEPGAVATQFEQRLYSAELALCQRYYQIGYGYLAGYTTASTTVAYNYPFPVAMRVAPTLITNSGQLNTNTTGANFSGADSRTAVLSATGVAAGGFICQSTGAFFAEL